MKKNEFALARWNNNANISFFPVVITEKVKLMLNEREQIHHKLKEWNLPNSKALNASLIEATNNLEDLQEFVYEVEQEMKHIRNKRFKKINMSVFSGAKKQSEAKSLLPNVLGTYSASLRDRLRYIEDEAGDSIAEKLSNWKLDFNENDESENDDPNSDAMEIQPKNPFMNFLSD